MGQALGTSGESSANYARQLLPTTLAYGQSSRKSKQAIMAQQRWPQAQIPPAARLVTSTNIAYPRHKHKYCLHQHKHKYRLHQHKHKLRLASSAVPILARGGIEMKRNCLLIAGGGWRIRNQRRKWSPRKSATTALKT